MCLMIIIPERKKAFLDSKIKMFCKSKNRDFGVSPWFWQKKNWNFSMFLFFAKNSQQNVFDHFLDILEKLFLKNLVHVATV